MAMAFPRRLAIRICLSWSRLIYHHQRVSVLECLRMFRQDLNHGAALVGLDLVHDLHGFDDADGIAFLDDTAHLDEGFCTRTGLAVESTDHGGFDHMPGGFGCRGGVCARLVWGGRCPGFGLKVCRPLLRVCSHRVRHVHRRCLKPY